MCVANCHSCANECDGDGECLTAHALYLNEKQVIFVCRELVASVHASFRNFIAIRGGSRKARPRLVPIQRTSLRGVGVRWRRDCALPSFCLARNEVQPNFTQHKGAA